VLSEIAAEAGLDPVEVTEFLGGERFAREVHAAHQQAERIGIRGVPVFIVDREHAISGAQPPEVLAGLLDMAGATRQTAAAR
jgi:predicted DsbA family dithiol-disulfide isomerase